MSHPLRCWCGQLQGHVSRPEKVMSRGVCYCRDCQAFAHFLGQPDEVLDALGGTDVVAIEPRYVVFTKGLDKLACMSLYERGLLRWYASCCNTAIGNTTRNPKLAYVGLVHTCLGDSSASRDYVFGRVRMSVNTQGAKGRPPSMPIRNARAIVRCMGLMAGARLSRSYRQTPFFKEGTRVPIAPPGTLTREEREALMASIS